VISDPDGPKDQADLRSDYRRSDRDEGPLLPDEHSRKSIYNQQRDVHTEQANSRALSARAMLHNTSGEERKHKNCAKDYP
jgi:hypothetical protein